MMMEEALQTDRFRNEQHKLLLHVLYTRSVIMIQLKRLLRPFGITPEQYNILRILNGQQGQPLALQDLSNRMLDPGSNTSRLVEKLRVKGLLQRNTCAQDRRRIDVLITPSGQKVIEQSHENLTALETLFEAQFDTIEAQKMNTALDGFHQAIHSLKF
ncbi:MAG: MarR family winged helix-turn-helix transcriptional regulator [Flavobacteriales bacterium]